MYRFGFNLISSSNKSIDLDASFKLLNKESYFINIGRGNTVNQKELLYALKNSILTGSIIDVFKKEPLGINSQLWELKNLLITPHIAGACNDAMLLTEAFIANKLMETICSTD